MGGICCPIFIGTVRIISRIYPEPEGLAAINTEAVCQVNRTLCQVYQSDSLLSSHFYHDLSVAFKVACIGNQIAIRICCIAVPCYRCYQNRCRTSLNSTIHIILNPFLKIRGSNITIRSAGGCVIMPPLNQHIISGLYILQKVIQFSFQNKGTGGTSANCTVFYDNPVCFVGLCLTVITIITLSFLHKFSEEIVNYLSPSGLRIITAVIGLYSGVRSDKYRRLCRCGICCKPCNLHSGNIHSLRCSITLAGCTACRQELDIQPAVHQNCCISNCCRASCRNSSAFHLCDFL